MFKTLVSFMVAGAVSAQQIHADAWSSDDVDQKRPPSMIVKRATLMAECRKEALMNERLCADKRLEDGLQRVCRKEVPIQQSDCRNKKMCELKLGFLQTKCIEAFNGQAYGQEEMSKAKVIDVGKCFTRILRDHMKCKDRVSETTHRALEKMKKLLEKETEEELQHMQLEHQHIEDEKMKAVEEAKAQAIAFEQEVAKADAVVDKEIVELAEEAVKEIVELEETETAKPEIEEPKPTPEPVIVEAVVKTKNVVPATVTEQEKNIYAMLQEAEDDNTELDEDDYTDSGSDA